jgi:hypothetical protein
MGQLGFTPLTTCPTTCAPKFHTAYWQIHMARSVGRGPTRKDNAIDPRPLPLRSHHFNKILQGKDHHCDFIIKGVHPRPSSPIQSRGTSEMALPFRVAFPNKTFKVRCDRTSSLWRRRSLRDGRPMRASRSSSHA